MYIHQRSEITESTTAQEIGNRQVNRESQLTRTETHSQKPAWEPVVRQQNLQCN